MSTAAPGATAGRPVAVSVDVLEAPIGLLVGHLQEVSGDVVHLDRDHS